MLIGGQGELTTTQKEKWDGIVNVKNAEVRKISVRYRNLALATNLWVFVSVLPCTNVHIIDKAQRQNSTNTVLYAGRFISTKLKLKY